MGTGKGTLWYLDVLKQDSSHKNALLGLIHYPIVSDPFPVTGGGCLKMLVGTKYNVYCRVLNVFVNIV